MARADTITLLALDRWARIIGVDPAHFATGASEHVQPLGAKCSDLWWQHSWQTSDRVSREDLAFEINMVEEELANLVGFWPAPKWMNDEVHMYPRPHRRDTFGGGLNSRAMAKSIQSHYAKIIEPGCRTVSLIAQATVAGGTLTFEDDDGDGHDEIAQIILPTTLTDIREIHVYFAGHSGDPAWEMRPPKSITIAGGNVTIKFWVWQVIDPDLWESLNSETARTAIDFLVPANLVIALDVYREYTDTTCTSARFYWEPDGAAFDIFCSVCGGTGCAACGLTTQDGCIHIRDVHAGILVPEPATYSENDAAWSSATWVECREPDQVKLWYRAGDMDQRFVAGTAWDPLTHWWAEIIAWVTTARLERPICACANATALFNELRTDLALSSRDGPSYAITDDMLENPLGTRVGEVKSWRRLRNLVGRRNRVAVV